MIGPDVQSCLARIREAEPQIHAFACVRKLPPLGQGPLDGVPFAAKDIFDTADMPTEWGTPLCAGRQPARDSSLVRTLRKLGGVLIGKTHTTAFAYFDPAPTHNPRSPGHTPGGSSSGSAAAVAAGMAAFALGSQTQGSVLRPASFCGVVGFKPTFGLLSLAGVMKFAPSLDTAGLFTATAEQMVELWKAMGYLEDTGTSAKIAALPVPDMVEPAMRKAFRSISRALRWTEVEPPISLIRLREVVRTVNDYEGARMFRSRLPKLRGTKMGDLIVRGLSIETAAYEEAVARMERARRKMEKFYAEFPVLAWPSALGGPPRGLASTGDPLLLAPFTGLGVPAISIPMPLGQGELPLGLQLTAAGGNDSLLLQTASQIARLIVR